MEIKVWYLSSCDTCKRILADTGLNDRDAVKTDIKHHPVTPEELEDMKRFTGSYRVLINSRSTQFRTMEKKSGDLTEEEARELLLTHYSFLKRPIVKIDDHYFIGNGKRDIQALTEVLNQSRE